MAEKRKDTSNGGSGALIKRAKQDEEDTSKSLINLSNQRAGTKNAIVGTVRVYVSQQSTYSTNVWSCRLNVLLDSKRLWCNW